MNSTNDPRQQQNGFNTHQTDSLIRLWVLFSVSSVVMILRLISQFGILRIIRADDVLMIIAWTLQAVKATTSTIAIYWGLGLHDWQLPSKQAFENVMKFEMLSMSFGTLCGIFGRVSFAVFLLYFIQRVSRPRTYLVWIIILLQVVINVLFLAIILAQCAPSVNGPWNAGLCRTSGSVLAIQYVQGAINAASNMCLTFLAVGLVLQIRASGYAKASLGILLSFSLIATVAEIVDTVEVSKTRNEGSDFAYRLNTWNYWYAIENAVIIITASMPKIRPVVLAAYQRLKKSRFWKKFTCTCRFRCFTRNHNRNATLTRLPSLYGRHILVADDHEESSILHRLKANPCSNSIYRKESKPTTIHSNQCSGPSQKPRRHCRHLSNTSGGTKFSLGSRSTTTTKASGFDSIDLASLDQQQLAEDFVPMSTSRLRCQTVITARDPPQPSASASAPYAMPQPPPTAITPTTSLSPPNGSGRSSRNSTRRGCNADGFTTTNSSFIFLPITNNNPSSSSSRGKSRSRRHNHNHNNVPAGSFPILQTSHFTIEYEDDNNVSACDDDSINQQPNHLGLIWANANGQPAEMTRARTRRYNEDDAEALQLHDVGCTLDDSSSRRNQS
ncbi:hypothetical protein ZTR_10418 [Talaromyces verruculosus]|nr:hypothetical protein ZTR_10418 [Talaromyces verruculosus]